MSTKRRVEVEEGPLTPRDRLFFIHKNLCALGLNLMHLKNADYGANDDPFRNFHAFGELGILVRMSDKLARLRTYCERGDLKVKTESVEDTIVDLINYSVLLYSYINREEMIYDGTERNRYEQGVRGDRAGEIQASRVPRKQQSGKVGGHNMRGGRGGDEGRAGRNKGRK